ncbi:Uncharacterised protein [Serratia marcescens]|nr:Uncharacterised protein [Serratia marcescens]
MALTESQSAKLSATIAENAAAEAKSYADLASKAKDFSDEAAESASMAASSKADAEIASNNAQNSAAEALISANSAASSASEAAVASNIYLSLSDAQNAITSGLIPLDGLFSYNSSDTNNYIDQGQNVDGIAKPTGKSYPSTEAVNNAVKEVTNLVKSNTANVDFAVVNSKGQPSVDITDGELTTSAFRIIRYNSGELYVSDKFGRSIEIARKNNGLNIESNGDISTSSFGVSSYNADIDGVFYADKFGRCKEIAAESNPDQQTWIAEQTAAMELIGAQSRNSVATGSSNVVTLLANLIHFILYGQSLQNGTEGWPAISIFQPFDNLMFGQSVMPASPTEATFTPRGGATLNSLVATCCDASGNSLTPEQVSALAPGTIAYGETPGESAINALRRRFIDYLVQSTDQNRKFVASAAGVGGRTAAQLSKGASPNLYQRYLDAMSGVSTIASTDSKSYQVGGFIYIQGENDYPSNTKDIYKGTTNTILSNMQADRIMPSGETRKSGIFMVQTGASFTVDTHDMAIGMAQIEISNERDDVYLVGGYYPYTDKNGHLDSNGYRWLGEKIAEIMFKVIVLREDWKPIQPLKAVYRNTDVLIAKHVPVPPLQSAEPYVINTATNYTDLGFTAIDRVSGVDTPISINSVQVSGLSTIHISLARSPVGELIIRYADKTYHNGNGMICDSSNGLSLNKYTYMPGSGMYASANIPALVDKNYDLRNWSVAYQITAEEV